MAHYAVANKNISGEIIDDELIIIDLTRGVYFTSKGAALPLWRAIIKGYGLVGIMEHLAKESGTPLSFVPAVEAWLAILVREGVLRVEDGQGLPLSDDFLAGSSASDAQAPILEMHDDLEDILLFDPVHDFDELGWPKHAKP